MNDIDQLLSDMNEIERREAHNAAQSGESGQSHGEVEVEAAQQATVPFGTFGALDLRVGRITEVRDHDGARKPMYVLRVDLGELGVRTIVAGIKAFYDKDTLVGKNIVIVSNLEQRKIAGVLSEGMLLAAEHGGDVVLLSPDRDIAPGSRIR